MFSDLFKQSMRLASGTMSRDEFFALKSEDQAAIAGGVAGALSFRDPVAAFELLSGTLRESEGEA